jgi:hypothetical protein
MIYWCEVSISDMKERSHWSFSEPSWAKAVRVASLDRPPSVRARSTPGWTGSMPALRKYLPKVNYRDSGQCLARTGLAYLSSSRSRSRSVRLTCPIGVNVGASSRSLDGGVEIGQAAKGTIVTRGTATMSPYWACRFIFEIVPNGPDHWVARAARSRVGRATKLFRRAKDVWETQPSPPLQSSVQIHDGEGTGRRFRVGVRAISSQDSSRF